MLGDLFGDDTPTLFSVELHSDSRLAPLQLHLAMLKDGQLEDRERIDGVLVEFDLPIL